MKLGASLLGSSPQSGLSSQFSCVLYYYYLDSNAFVFVFVGGGGANPVCLMSVA